MANAIKVILPIDSKAFKNDTDLLHYVGVCAISGNTSDMFALDEVYQYIDDVVDGLVDETDNPLPEAVKSEEAKRMVELVTTNKITPVLINQYLTELGYTEEKEIEIHDVQVARDSTIFTLKVSEPKTSGHVFDQDVTFMYPHTMHRCTLDQMNKVVDFDIAKIYPKVMGGMNLVKRN